MAKTPRDSNYCKAVKCQYRHGNECSLEECARNRKRIEYWVRTGELAPGDEVDT